VFDARSVPSSSLLSSDAARASWDGDAVTDSTRERTLATTLSCPGICRMSVVNWTTKWRRLNYRGQH
jgi:hypothetical protein